MAQVPPTAVVWTGDGSTTQFSFPFPYQRPADVFVTVNGNPVTTVFVTSNTVQITPAPTAGAKVRIFRSTPAEAVANDFQLGAPFLAENIDENFEQSLFILQESLDRSPRRRVTDTGEEFFDAGGMRVSYLGRSSHPQDATTRLEVDEGDAASRSYADVVIEDKMAEVGGASSQIIANRTAAENAEANAESARDQAVAASEASGDVAFFDTYAAASSAVPVEGQVVEVFKDETQDNSRTRYRWEAGVLVFKITFSRVQADSMFDLVNLPAPTADGFGIELRAFYSDIDTGGGGRFYWDASRAKAAANGGTIIDPDTIGGWDGTASTVGDFLDAQGGGLGVGCWVKVGVQGILHPEFFGAVGDNVTNDRKAIERTAKVLYEAGGGKILFSPGRTYYFNNVFPYSNIEWDFNYCNLRLRNDPTYGGFNALFANPNGYPGVGNPLNPDADFRYDRHFVSDGQYSDQHRPLDTAITEYPVGTISVTMDGWAQGLAVDDWVFFCSGPHDGIDDWSGYQHFEMELCKIRSIAGDTVTFYEPTCMTHRLLQPSAFAPGQSQYGAVAWWTLSKVSDFSMEENLTFKNLRMVVDDTGWDGTKRLWNLHYVHNFTMVDCHIHAPSSLTQLPAFYNRGRGQTYADCRFTGKWGGVCTGADLASTDQRYLRCLYSFTGGLGEIHSGERFANILFDDCTIDYGSSPTVGAPNSPAWMFSEECENIKIRNCKLLNFNKMLGTPGINMRGFGSLLLENNEMRGYWLQPPLRFVATGETVAKLVGNTVDCTISSAATASQGMSFWNVVAERNYFNVLTESSGKTNITGGTSFFSSPPHQGTFQGNINIPDVLHETIAGHRFVFDPTRAGTYAESVQGKLVLAHPADTNTSAFVSAGNSIPAEKMGITVEVYGFVTTTSTASVRYQIMAGDVGTGSAMSQQNVNVPLAGIAANTEFLVGSINIGLGSDSGIVAGGFQVRISRGGIDVNDTFTGTLYITHARIVTFPSMGS